MFTVLLIIFDDHYYEIDALLRAIALGLPLLPHWFGAAPSVACNQGEAPVEKILV